LRIAYYNLGLIDSIGSLDLNFQAMMEADGTVSELEALLTAANCAGGSVPTSPGSAGSTRQVPAAAPPGAVNFPSYTCPPDAAQIAAWRDSAVERRETAATFESDFMRTTMLLQADDLERRADEWELACSN
jgi:hypothetical protein